MAAVGKKSPIEWSRQNCHNYAEDFFIFLHHSLALAHPPTHAHTHTHTLSCYQLHTHTHTHYLFERGRQKD